MAGLQMIPMKKISLALLGLGLSLQAQAASDLLQVYQEALSKDATYQSARAARQAGQEKLPQGRALLLPSVSLGANTTYNDVDTQYSNPGIFSSGNRKYNSNGYSVNLTQPIYRKQNFAQYEQAKSSVVQTDAQFATAQQDLILRVAQAYFDVLLAQYNVTLAGTQKEAIAEQLAQAKRSFEVGTATITDTNDAQARYDLVIAQEIAAQNDLEVKQRAFDQIVGHPAGELVAVKPEVPLEEPSPMAMDAWVEKALNQNPQVVVQKAALDIADQQLDVARAGHYPTLDLVAGYSDASQSGGTTGAFDQTAKTIGLQLNLPIYQGGATNSRVREALANQEKARQDMEAVSRGVAQQVRQAFLGVTSGIAQVKALQQAVVSNQTSLDSTKLGLDVGVRTSVDLLNARQQLFSARRDLAQALYNYILAKLQLEAAVGDLSEADVVKVNGWLNEASRPKS
jgi:outer membrane protein